MVHLRRFYTALLSAIARRNPSPGAEGDSLDRAIQETARLAVEMEKVFKEKKIAREALAAVILFCEAARREAATVELARRVIGDIEAARRTGGRG